MKKTCFVICCLFVIAVSSKKAVSQELFSPNIGYSLSPLQFQDLGGTHHRLDWSAVEPTVTVLFFFEPRCSSCFREFVYFNRISQLARDLNFEVFAVEASGQEPEEVGKEIARVTRMLEKPSFTIVPDPSYTLSKVLNVETVPSTFVMERHGVVISRKEGFDNRHAVDLARMMERLIGAEKGSFTPALSRLSISKEEEQEFGRVFEERKAEGTEAVSPAPLELGAVVAPFTFSDITGRERTWSPVGEGDKSATVVLFWGALCQPCIAEMAFLDRMYATAGALGLQVIAVEGTGLDRERVEHVMGRYRRFHGMPSYIIAVDPKRLLSEQFGVGGALPRTFIIGRGGTIVYYTDDFVSEGKSTMVRRIEEILGIEGGTLQKGIDSAGVAGPPSAAGAQVDTKGATGEEELFGACLLEAETLFRNFQYTAALPLYRRCLEIDGKSVSVRERLANIYQRQGEYGLALEQWNEVLLLEPGNEEAARQAERLRSLAGSTPVEQP